MAELIQHRDDEMVFCNALMWMVRMVVLRNAWITYPLVVGLGFAALMDETTHHTVPLLTWRVMVMLTSLALWSSGLGSLYLTWRHASPSTKEPTSPYGSKVDPTTTRDFERNVAWLRYSLPIALIYLVAWVQIEWLYKFTSDRDGSQAVLDSGFDQTQALPYPAHLKMFFLQVLQLAPVVATITLVGLAVVCRRHPK